MVPAYADFKIESLRVFDVDVDVGSYPLTWICSCTGDTDFAFRLMKVTRTKLAEVSVEGSTGSHHKISLNAM